MPPGWVVLLTAFAYLCALFAVAHFGDTWGRRLMGSRARPTIYALSLAVYCTSWTFFGSVGSASGTGYDFLTVYIGPFLVVAFGQRFLARVVGLAKSQNITSIADFLASRYGKSEAVSALVVLVMIVGVVPYIGLQLKAVSVSLATMVAATEAGGLPPVGRGDWPSLVIAWTLAGFAVAFGTRRVEASEHHGGLIFAIAAESLIKILAFMAVGVFSVWGLAGGPGALVARAAAVPEIVASLTRPIDLGTWAMSILLSTFAIVLLPRQFHVMVVEYRAPGDLARARWMFPAYLVAINLFVLPIAVVGRLTFPDGTIDRDMTVLLLPLAAHADAISLVAMIGGLSAATAMVVVASVALSIMISNDLVMPLVVRLPRLRHRAAGAGGDLSGTVLVIRRLAIVGVILLAYLYLHTTQETALASIGFLAFAAVAQAAPAFFGGLVWKRARAAGVIAGVLAGMALWAYTLLLPSLAPSFPALGALVADGPFGLAALRPTALFGLALPPLVHSGLWSLGANTLVFVGVSLLRAPSVIEAMQADLFVGPAMLASGPALGLFRSGLTVGELEAAVARYLGAEHTRRAFAANAGPRDDDPARQADTETLGFAGHFLASAIGAASSRLVISLLLRRRNVSPRAALRLVDDASAAIQYNRDLLQHALDHVGQGITVYDRHLRLMCWNREFPAIFGMPPGFLRVGLPLDEIVGFNAARGVYGAGLAEEIVSSRMESLLTATEPTRLRVEPAGDVLEVRSSRLPDGGVVTIYTDVTAAVLAEETLAAANETLERRVGERTDQLQRVAEDLARAKEEADEANQSKTRFLAAASHDILQPLNAARLYATSLLERVGEARPERVDDARLATNIDASLDAVEEILTALLDISRLDAGAMKPEISVFRIDEVLDQLRIEFAPMARERGLRLDFVGSSTSVRSDRRLLRRLLQNLISNAVKYTPRGRVLVGCRRVRRQMRIEVWDTGLGIPKAHHRRVFQEFQRLDAGQRVSPGVGLGLSIVQRISKVLGHKVVLRSWEGRGSLFGVELPIAAAVAPAPQTARDNPPTRPEPLVGLTVLAIDNEPRILEGMRDLLGGWGCTVATASDMREVDAALRSVPNKPDIVIADYHLDTSNGIEAIMALRWRLEPHLPGVLVTADRTAAIREEALAKSIRVMNKPLKPAALRALLTQVRAARELPAEP